MNEIGIQHSRARLLLLVLIGVIATWGSSESWAQNTNGQIGFVIAANGTVTVASQNATPRPASLRQHVFPSDTITTGPEASAKVLFDDNTILNVMENSQVEIAEYVYDPETAKRSTIFRLVQGQIKVLVADFYAATGSRFEIHTPTTVAAARGTEYVVFTSLVNGVPVTTVAVTSGSVTVTAGDQTVTVAAGSFTTVAAGAAPVTPAPTNAAPAVQNAVAMAEVKTAPAVVGQVQIAMAQTTAQQVTAIAAVTGGTPLAAVAAPAAVPSVPSVPSGISQTMGTTTTPCTVVSASGNVPLGCTP